MVTTDLIQNPDRPYESLTRTQMRATAVSAVGRMTTLSRWTPLADIG